MPGKRRIGRGDMSEYPVVTICGSMRYYDKMLEVANKLTGDGNIVLMPHIAKYVGGVKSDDNKIMLDNMHKRKIDMSESIVVVGTHIGESTASEIAYAQNTSKKITYWTEHFGPME